MADPPQQQPPDDPTPAEDALPQPVTGTRPLVERAEVVWLVAWIALALILLGLVSTLAMGPASTGDAGDRPQFLTDINSAPATELALLPGVGPQLAERIIAEREAGGPFTSAEQLARVRGIGPKTIEQVAPLVICGPRLAAPSASVAVLPAQPTGVAEPARADRSAALLMEPTPPAPVHAQNPLPTAAVVE